MYRKTYAIATEPTKFLLSQNYSLPREGRGGVRFSGPKVRGFSFVRQKPQGGHGVSGKPDVNLFTRRITTGNMKISTEISGSQRGLLGFCSIKQAKNERLRKLRFSIFVQ